MIEVKDLSKTYDRRRRNANRVLRDVSVTLPDRGLVCILGPSGCGKTSLLNAIGGLDIFDSGTVTVGGKTLGRSGSRAFEAERNRNFGYIFQNYYLLDEHSAAYNVYLGLHSLELTHEEKIDRVFRALEAVDMDRYVMRKVGELSGGQRQRVAIARALARRPRVIFADEPTGNLDEGNTRSICSLLRRASKDSLVIMVTHEERIARFFADRIIRLGDGVISEDSEDWQRGILAGEADGTIYTDGLEAYESDGGTAAIKIWREPGTPPVKLTIAALHDRIILKVSDPRIVSLGTADESPRIVEGSVSELTLDVLEKSEDIGQRRLFAGSEAAAAKAGSGVTVPMMLREALQLCREKSIRRAGMRVFLCFLTVLTLLIVGDFAALSRIDPEDFITTDSHLLLLTIDQGRGIDEEGKPLSDRANDFVHDLYESGLDFDFVPVTSVGAKYYATVFHQLGSVPLSLPSAFSYVPLDRLDESSLIAGRMPESDYEVVADRRVIEAMLEDEEGVVQNSIVDPSYFLGAELALDSRSASITVVGIADSGERSVYVGRTVLLTVRNGGTVKAISFSESKEMVSAEYYSGMTLADDECIVNYSAAGAIYRQRIGDYFSVAGIRRYKIKDVVRIPDSDALVILNDSQLDELLLTGSSPYSVYLYCENKTEVRQYINRKVRGENDTTIIVRVTDPYQTQYNAYSRAVQLRADARSIVTVTVLAVCVVMLWLLCRTQAEGRIGMLAVYRLLGIPNRKLYTIFSFEGFISALITIVPSSLVTWAAVLFIQTRTEIELPLILSWQTVAVTALGVLMYYLFTSVLPLLRLLRMPPARLAARYDM